MQFILSYYKKPIYQKLVLRWSKYSETLPNEENIKTKTVRRRERKYITLIYLTHSKDS